MQAGRTAAPAKVRRMARAFVASADLKVMARQLVENRTPAAYAGVEDYARRHAASDAGALAWLAVGYCARSGSAISAGDCSAGKSKTQCRRACGTTSAIWKPSPTAPKETAPRLWNCYATSMTRRRSRSSSNDVVDVYGKRFDCAGQDTGGDCIPGGASAAARASVELALGKCYLHTDHPEKGMEILKHLYFTMPTSGEAAEAAAC